MPRRLAGELASATRHCEYALRRDGLTRTPGLHMHAVIVEENHRQDIELKAFRLSADGARP